MVLVDSIYFELDGFKWVIEKFEQNGVLCCENTHPVYDENGNPIKVF